MHGNEICTPHYVSIGTSGSLRFCLIRDTNLTAVYVIGYNGGIYGETKLLDSPVIAVQG